MIIVTNLQENGGDQASSTIRLDAAQPPDDLHTQLMPVRPAATVDEIVAQVVGPRNRQVELLVPNGTTALQSADGCAALRKAADEAGIHVLVFTADEQTLRAASSAGLDVLPVGRPIAPPDRLQRRGPRRPASPFPPAVPPGDNNGAYGGGAAPEPVFSAPRPRMPVDGAVPSRQGQASSPVSDADFLAGLAAFEQAQADDVPARGTMLATDEGAILFDAPGDLGVPRPVAADDEGWETAFDELGVTMASEPESPLPLPPRVPGPDVPTGREPGLSRRAASGLPDGSPRRPKGGMLTARDDGRSQRQAAPDQAREPRQRRWRSLLWPLVMLGLVAVIGGGWIGATRLGFGLAGPSIMLTPAVPQAQAQQVNGVIIPVRPDVAKDASSYALQGAVVEQPVNIAVAGEAISTTLTPIGRARGTLFLRNTLSQAVTVRAGTPVPAANGVQFVVAQTATVPAAAASLDGVTYGRGEVALVATIPGASGNISAGSITSIPGFEGTLRVEQGEFTGGSDQEVRIVRVEDVNRVLPEAISRLYAAGLQALQDKAPGGLQLSTATITPTLESLQQLQGVEYGVFPPIGGVTPDGTFRVEVRATFGGVAEPAGAPLQQQLPVAVHNQLVNTGKIAADAQVQVKDWTVANGGLRVDALVAPAARVKALSPDFLREVERAIAGKPRNEATAYLQGLVKAGTIQSFSPIPDTWDKIPAGVSVRQSGS